MDKLTDLSEEVVHFRETYANIEINKPSTFKSFKINFEEQDMPHQINLVGNEGRQRQVANVQSAGKGGNVN